MSTTTILQNSARVSRPLGLNCPAPLPSTTPSSRRTSTFCAVFLSVTSEKLSAAEAETLVTVTGVAEDGKSTQVYTIHVLRMPAYTGIIPTVEVIDPATIPSVPPLEIPGVLELPLVGEVKTLYVAIAAAVLLVVILFLLGFLIGRGSGGGRDDEYDDDDRQPPEDVQPILPYSTGSVPRLVPREETAPRPAEESVHTVPAPQPKEETPPQPEESKPAVDEPTQADEDQVRTMSLEDLLDDIHNM